MFQPYVKGNRASWTKRGKTLRLTTAYDNKRYVAVVGAISADRGPIHYKAKYKAFRTQDFIRFLLEIIRRNRNKKMVFFLDNAKIHNNSAVLGLFEDDDRFEDVRALFNCVGRPDFMGIEGVWSHMKRRYRSAIDQHKANCQDWDQLDLVRDIIQETPVEVQKSFARGGNRQLELGTPVKPIALEKNSSLSQHSGSEINDS